MVYVLMGKHLISDVEREQNTTNNITYICSTQLYVLITIMFVYVQQYL